MANNKNYMDILNPKLDNATTLQDCFASFGKMINRDLHVATLAVFKDIVKTYDNSLGYGIVSVAPIPLEKNRAAYNINAYFIDDYSFDQNELLAIIYSDLNFEKNLNSGKNNQVASDGNLYHSQMNAIVIPATKLGETGKSAYQLAVDNGYHGSVTEWLASLVGPEGPEGPAGETPKFYRHHMTFTGKDENNVDTVIYMEVLLLNSSAYSNQTRFMDIQNLSDLGVIRVEGIIGSSTEFKFLEPKVGAYSKYYTSLLNYKNGIGTNINFAYFYVYNDVVSEVK